MKIPNKERIKKVLELRRSNAATPIPSKKKYSRKIKHKKTAVGSQRFWDQLKFQLARIQLRSRACRYGCDQKHPRFCSVLQKMSVAYGIILLINERPTNEIKTF